jgi:hypothetical protein
MNGPIPEKYAMVGKSRNPIKWVRFIPKEIVSNPKNMPVIEMSRPTKPENRKTSAINIRNVVDMTFV